MSESIRTGIKVADIEEIKKFAATLHFYSSKAYI